MDGAKLYASYLVKEKDVLYIGVSGEKLSNLRVNHYLWFKDTSESQAILQSSNELCPFENYLALYKENQQDIDYQDITNYSKKLNNELHKNKIEANNRALLFSGILIALQDKVFAQVFKNHNDPKRLADALLEALGSQLKKANMESQDAESMEASFSFIRNHTSLIAKGSLIKLVRDIHQKVSPFIERNVDAISKCYVEFLKYANSDKQLGIVLTPPHITKISCEFAKVTSRSVVFDNCCGTSGFLIAAMNKMISDADGSQRLIENIKREGLVGIEYQDSIFPLAVSNMIIHGDGKSNILKGDCLDSKIGEKVKRFKPTVGLLNPPYDNKDRSGVKELEFVENNLSLIEPRGCVVAVLPMRCTKLASKGKLLEIKKRLLEQHTLEAVMSMPDSLFHPVNVVTCIMVFLAHVPHNTSNKKTWFGYWKDDGYIIRKGGRFDLRKKWKDIRQDWLSSFRDLIEKPGKSVLRQINEKDEWCVEAYMDIDHSQLTRNFFIETVRQYLAYQVSVGKFDSIQRFQSSPVSNLDLDVDNWSEHKLDSIFRLEKCKCGSVEDFLEDVPAWDPDGIAYVAAKKTNNGVRRFVRKEDRYVSKGNAIVFVGGGAGSVGLTTYQFDDFIGTSTNNVGYNENINQYTGLFLVTVLDLQRPKYSFGRSYKIDDIKKTLIKLPTLAGKPDWVFMEGYIKSLQCAV